MTDEDFVSSWFVTQSPRVLGTGYVVLGPEESDAFHREILGWSATVWGRYAYLRELVPLIRRGRAFFGALPGYSGLSTPVLWVHETWSVTTAIDVTWDELLRCLTVWDDSLSTKFPVHFFHPKLDDAHFVYDW